MTDHEQVVESDEDVQMREKSKTIDNVSKSSGSYQNQ